MTVADENRCARHKDNQNYVGAKLVYKLVVIIFKVNIQNYQLLQLWFLKYFCLIFPIFFAINLRLHHLEQISKELITKVT